MTLLARPEIHEQARAAKVPSVLEQARIEVRLLSIVLTSSFLYDLLEPVLYFFSVGTSTLHRVMAMSHMPGVIVAVFITAMLVTVPLWLSLVFTPTAGLAERLPRWLACQAAVVATMCWMYLAVLALPLDYGPLSWFYARNALGALIMAAVYALSLNAQQVRQLKERVNDAQARG